MATASWMTRLMHYNFRWAEAGASATCRNCHGVELREFNFCDECDEGWCFGMPDACSFGTREKGFLFCPLQNYGTCERRVCDHHYNSNPEGGA